MNVIRSKFAWTIFAPALTALYVLTLLVIVSVARPRATALPAQIAVPTVAALVQAVTPTVEAPTSPIPVVEVTVAPTAITIPPTVTAAPPTTVPTTVPTAVPTTVPTTMPTEMPTTAPTTAPTEVPTTIPTTAATEAPTVAPTEAPRLVATAVPTAVPTRQPTVVPTAAVAPATAVPAPARAAAPPQAPVPVGLGPIRGPLPRLIIPRIGVNSFIETIGQLPDGGMQTPSRWEDVGWFQPGYPIGQPGNAVIAGHLDSDGGPAVFWSLGVLSPGDHVYVDLGPQTRIDFLVQDNQVYGAESSPMLRIFGRTPAANLNLITCGGLFNSQTRLYTNRQVVYTTRVN